MEAKETVEARLRQEADFAALFSRTNLMQGLYVWAKSTGIVLLLGIVLGLLGLISLLGGFAVIALQVLTLYLMQVAVTAEGLKRYQFHAIGTAWWSTFWRATVYLLPVSFLLGLMMPAELRTMSLDDQMNTDAFLMASLILMILSILPLGLATSKALLISYLKQQDTEA